MKRFLFSSASLVLMCCACLSLIGCSDDDNEKLDPQSPEYIAMSKATPEAMALRTILSRTAGIDSLPDNWRSGYTVEPTIGDVLDESQPFVRTLAVNDAAEAVAFYNSLAGQDLPATATSHTLTLKEEGCQLSLNVTGGTDVIATIGVQARQLPHLSAIRLVPVSAMGENASDFETYYHMGDVVYDEEEGTYWICARPANALYKKKDSHWFSFDLLTKEHFHTEKATKDRAETIVPYDLDDNVQMMDHLIALLTFLADPDGYADVVGHEMKNGLAGLGNTYTQSDIKNISAYWTKKKVWSLLPFSKDYLKQPQINVYYKGYSSKLFSSKIHLWCRSYMGNGHLNASEVSVDWDMKVNRPFNITKFIKGKGFYGETPVAGPDKALVVRYRSASQMAHSLWTPDPDKPIEGLDPVHIYRDMKTGVRGSHYYLGDVLKDENTGIYWFCGIPSISKNKAYFYTLDNRALNIDSESTIANGVSSTNTLMFLLGQLATLARDAQYARTVAFIQEKTRLDLNTLFVCRGYEKDKTQWYYCATAFGVDKKLGKAWADVGVRGNDVYLYHYYHPLGPARENVQHLFTDFYDQEKVDSFAFSALQLHPIINYPNLMEYRTSAVPSTVSMKDLTWNYDKGTWVEPSLFTMFNHRGLLFAEMVIDETAKLPSHLTLIANTDSYWTDENRYEIIEHLYGITDDIDNPKEGDDIPE